MSLRVVHTVPGDCVAVGESVNVRCQMHETEVSERALYAVSG